ncbi:TetR/AcrR family transcriptional regulator [Cohnella sp. AR92]|uniref:TetR/AcrR family transcriptional regulator n=1 Tax=Cohnella sp. AR92 TaxID=648716 RepID=UPI000F8C8EEB|nr:TetR/AcrR family transcriptional regulator [Cohnella sp. AR92]RUS48971.1 TetR/AcrR family transcriptional regulator [Cohnella sp. AR92]
MIKQSLRYIKKEATSQSLAKAAFDLALERGLDGFTVDDIVQAAGYSRRTFANYFSCKEEAVATGATVYPGSEEAECFLVGMSEETPLIDILYDLIKLQLTADLMRQMRELVRLKEKHPSLEPYFLGAVHRLQMTAQETFHGWSGGRYDEVYTHLLLGALFGAMLPLVDGRIHVLLPGESEADNPGALAFDQYLNKIYGYLRNGF